MNIYELDQLIACLDVREDKDLIVFYNKKRVELVSRINQKIKDII